MGFKMSVPYLGLTRKVGESGAHKAYGEAICKEAGYERASRSKTLDRTLSDRNSYVGYTSGAELWDDLVEAADSYRVKVTRKDKDGNPVVHERPLRKDAIVGFAVIWKPPADVIRRWDPETRERFFADCYAVAEELEPELFQPSNIRMRARHKDEVRFGGEDHEHAVGVPLTFDGRYNGSDMLNHMRRNFNKNFAKHMRDRGWDMDDLELYDPERARVDPEYREYRREVRRNYGKTVNDYAESKALERAEKAVEALSVAQDETVVALREQLRAEVETDLLLEEQEAERVRHEAELDAIQADKEALLDALYEGMSADFEVQRHAYESELYEMARRLELANKDMERALAHVRMRKSEAKSAEKRRDVANAEADAAEARKSEADEAASRVAAEVFEQQSRSDEREAELEEMYERLDPAAIVSDFLSHAQKKLPGVSRSVFAALRGVISGWAEDWFKSFNVVDSDPYNLSKMAAEYTAAHSRDKQHGAAYGDRG
ncbi:MAG: hypothetical protein IKF78_06735 [Atopobiaceae bacterium]|nr:hypothetical protein [Atopobiaceae bacterium]